MPRKIPSGLQKHQGFTIPLFSLDESRVLDSGCVDDWHTNLGYSQSDIEENFTYFSRGGMKLMASLAVFRKGKPHTPDMLKYISNATSQYEKAALEIFRFWFQELPNIDGAVWKKDRLPHFYSNTGGEPVPITSFAELSQDGKGWHGRTIQDASDLTANLLALHNYIYANEGYSSYEAFSEILKLLFVKMEDERQNSEAGSKFFIDDQEFSAAIANTGKRNCEEFFARINGLFAKAKSDYPSVFRGGDSINLKLSTLAFAVSRLQEFDLTHSPSDIKGAAFQKIVSAAHRGERGQFITPYQVVRLMVNFLRPRPGEVVLDPACGTGSFLIEALRYMNQTAHNTKVNDLHAGNLYGIEINQAVARVAMMQMILFGGRPENILCADALDCEALETQKPVRETDIILTNPPFGSQGRILLRSILDSYELGHKWVNNGERWQRIGNLMSAQIPDILFIERCLQLLRDGGRMGIVLPNGDLENSSLGYVRQFIMDNADVLAVVALPQDTFSPHGTGVRASVLFLQKRSREQHAKRRSVFFGVIENIGYDGGKHSVPRYRTDASGNILRDEEGDPILDEDVTAMVSTYEAFLNTGAIGSTGTAFARTIDEIGARLDPAYYTPEYVELVVELQRRGALPLKSVARIITKKSEALRHPEKRIRYIEISDVDPKYPSIVNATEMSVFEAPSRAAYEVHEGDIITAVSGNSTGTPCHATAYVTKEYDGCICTNGFRVIRATHTDPFYLLGYMKTPYFLKQVFRCRTGAAIPAISDADLANSMVLLPARDIQDHIACEIKRSLELRSQALDVLQAVLSNVGSISNSI